MYMKSLEKCLLRCREHYIEYFNKIYNKNLQPDNENNKEYIYQNIYRDNLDLTTTSNPVSPELPIWSEITHSILPPPPSPIFINTILTLSDSWHCENCNTFNNKSSDICKTCCIKYDSGPLVNEILNEIYLKIQESEESHENSLNNDEERHENSLNNDEERHENSLNNDEESHENSLNNDEYNKMEIEDLINLEDWEYIQEK